MAARGGTAQTQWRRRWRQAAAPKCSKKTSGGMWRHRWRHAAAPLKRSGGIGGGKRRQRNARKNQAAARHPVWFFIILNMPGGGVGGCWAVRPRREEDPHQHCMADVVQKVKGNSVLILGRTFFTALWFFDVVSPSISQHPKHPKRDGSRGCPCPAQCSQAF